MGFLVTAVILGISGGGGGVQAASVPLDNDCLFSALSMNPYSVFFSILCENGTLSVEVVLTVLCELVNATVVLLAGSVPYWFQLARVLFVLSTSVLLIALVVRNPLTTGLLCDRVAAKLLPRVIGLLKYVDGLIIFEPLLLLMFSELRYTDECLFWLFNVLLLIGLIFCVYSVFPIPLISAES